MHKMQQWYTHDIRMAILEIWFVCSQVFNSKNWLNQIRKRPLPAVCEVRVVVMLPSGVAFLHFKCGSGAKVHSNPLFRMTLNAACDAL